MGEVDFPVLLQMKRAELTEKLAQAEQQVNYWGVRRLQLQGALLLLDEISAPLVSEEKPWPEERPIT